MTSSSPAPTPAHEHEYHALWSHLGPLGRQDIHYHPCTEGEPGDCYAVLAGYGRDCDGERATHAESELPLPDDLMIPGEPSIPPGDHMAAAVKAALAARAHALIDRPTPTALSDERLTQHMLEAALPHLAVLLQEQS